MHGDASMQSWALKESLGAGTQLGRGQQGLRVEGTAGRSRAAAGGAERRSLWAQPA